MKPIVASEDDGELREGACSIQAWMRDISIKVKIKIWQ